MNALISLFSSMIFALCPMILQIGGADVPVMRCGFQSGTQAVVHPDTIPKKIVCHGPLRCDCPPLDPARLMANGSQAFGIELLKRLRQERDDTDQNVVLSPLSVSLALTLAWNGADGDTRIAIEEALGLQGLTIDEILEGTQKLMSSLRSTDSSSFLSIANSIWLRDGFEVQPRYLEDCLTFLGAKAAVRDFSSVDTLDEINSWVSDQTRGLIPSILDELTPEAVAVLINAIYFKGDWAVPFSEPHKSTRPFVRADGRELSIPTMKREGTMAYQMNKMFQAVSLPYAQDGLEMVILLPRQSVSVDSLLTACATDEIQQWMGAFVEQEGTLTLPRFRIEYRSIINDALRSLGLGVAFDGGAADFSRMAVKDSVFISQVVHRAVIEVDEKGTKAAAVTAVMMEKGLAAPRTCKRFGMYVDRPFVFMLRDTNTDTTLFVGSVDDPSKT